jgi:hypothetical protein
MKKKQEIEEQAQKKQKRMDSYFVSKTTESTLLPPADIPLDLAMVTNNDRAISYAPIMRIKPISMEEFVIAIQSGQDLDTCLLQIKLKEGEKRYDSISGLLTFRKIEFPSTKHRAEPEVSMPLPPHLMKFANARMKLLHFSENVRPAYYGTWSKKSEVVKPR